MTPEEQCIAVAVLEEGYTFKDESSRYPDEPEWQIYKAIYRGSGFVGLLRPGSFSYYLTEPKILNRVERKMGLADRERHDIRVKWVNHLRDIVSRRMPKNKTGAALISDVDLYFATQEERVEALLRTFKKWV